jgi:hypothetical protein
LKGFVEFYALQKRVSTIISFNLLYMLLSLLYKEGLGLCIEGLEVHGFQLAEIIPFHFSREALKSS